MAILLYAPAGIEPRIGELSIYAPPIWGHVVNAGIGSKIRWQGGTNIKF